MIYLARYKYCLTAISGFNETTGGRGGEKNGMEKIVFYCATSVASRVNFTPDGTAGKF